MERGKAYDDHGGGPFHIYGICGRAMGIATHFCRVVLLLRLPSDDVHRALERPTTNKRCHREQKKPTGNHQRGSSTEVRTKSPSLLHLFLVTNCSNWFSCRVFSTLGFRHIHAHQPSTQSLAPTRTFVFVLNYFSLYDTL